MIVAEYTLKYTAKEIENRLEQVEVHTANISQLSEDINNIGGTIEVTSGEPTKENTVVTISPSSETTNIYTTEEVDAKLEQLSEEKVDYIQLANAVNSALEQAKASGEFDGEDGSDYVLTDADKEEIAEKVPYVKVLESPAFVDSIDEMTDTSKAYVLKSDGMFYLYKTRTVIQDGSKTPNFTNLMDDEKAYIKEGSRWSLSGGKWETKTGCVAVVVPFNVTGGDYTIRMRNAKQGGGYKYLYYGSGSDNAEKFTSSMAGSWGTDNNGDDVFTGSNSSVLNGYVTFTIDGTVNYDDIIVTLNEEITYTVTEGGTQTITEWSNTGISYNQPTDYESRVIANERNIENLKSRTSSLENQLSSISISSNGTTVFDTPAFAPVPQLPVDGSDGSDFNVNDITTQQAYDYMDVLCNKYKQYITKQTLGKDESGNYDYNRYVLCMSYWKAWQRENYPRMFAWQNGSAIIYSVSVSPRVGDTMYITPYVGTVYETVTAVNCTAGTLSTRTVNGIVFTRYESGDIEPTIVYMKPTYYKGNFEVATVYDSSFNSLTTVSSVGNGSFVGADGVTYLRYPFEDRKADKTKPFSIFLLANEHGGDNTGDSLVPSITTMRLAKDLCKNTTNPFLQWLKGNAMITMIPVGNPYGYPMKPSDSKGYYNFNGMNINRNYDTPGWATSDTNYGGVETFGEYAGSENETQYIMNTMRLCKPKVGISMHGLGFHDDDLVGVVPDDTANAVYQGCGFDSKRMPKIAEVLYSAYGVGMGGNSSTVQHFNNCGKSPAYIQYVGATGGLIEISSLEGCTNKENTSIAMEQAYTQLLLFLQTWCEEAIEKMS